MVLKMKNLSILGVQWKIQLLGGGGVSKNQYVGGHCLKKGGFGKFADLRGAWQERRGVLRGWGGEGFDTPVSTMIILFHLELLIIDLPKINSSILMDIVTIPVD